MTVDSARLVAGFEAAFGGAPTHVARAPGRVNLIGEHIDYCGLPVLPMAIDRAVSVAFRVVPAPRVRVVTAAVGLAPVTFAPRPPIPPGPAGDWANYARAAVEAAESHAGRSGEPPGLDAFVDTDLPIAAGLSSSSALVVGMALAWLRARGVEPGPEPAARLALAESLARGERYVGTAGGGMDQAACLLGREGHALRIGFDPLDATPIAVPPRWRFLVAHSGERAEKSGRVREAYNARTREAAEALAGVLAAAGSGPGVVAPEGAPGPPAADVDVAAEERAAAGADRGHAYGAALKALGAEAALALGARALAPTLARRFRHVVTEHGRVRDAVAALRSADLPRFGALLCESHASLRADCEVSTPGLDALVAAAVGAGAAGARLTGAGLGGCIVAACDEASVVDVRRALEEVGAPPVFIARPAEGAAVETA